MYLSKYQATFPILAHQAMLYARGHIEQASASITTIVDR